MKVSLTSHVLEPPTRAALAKIIVEARAEKGQNGLKQSSPIYAFLGRHDYAKIGADNVIGVRCILHMPQKDGYVGLQWNE